jgi:hypothetical protein
MDHLWEDINYYDKLASIENKIEEATSGVLDGTGYVEFRFLQ